MRQGLSVVIILLILLNGCNFFIREPIAGEISSNIYYDGSYVIYTRSIWRSYATDDDFMDLLGEILYIADVRNGTIFIDTINFKNSVNLHYDLDMDVVNISKTEENIYLSSEYLENTIKINIDTKDKENLIDSLHKTAFFVNYSSDETKGVIINAYDHYYINNGINILSYEWYFYGDYFALNWDLGVLLNADWEDDCIKLIDLESGNESILHLEDNIIIQDGIKSKGNYLYIYDAYPTECCYIYEYKDYLWEYSGQYNAKYFNLADDSTYCIVDYYNIVIFNINDSMIFEL